MFKDNALEDFFWEKPLYKLNEKEWEALCDGCGLCCLHKLEDMDSGSVYSTNVACDLLDLESCACSNYSNRHQYVSDCIKLTYGMIKEINWLPKTCAYVLRHKNKPLPIWHKLISGSSDSVHEFGISKRHKVIHERQMTKALQHYIEWDELNK